MGNGALHADTGHGDTGDFDAARETPADFEASMTAAAALTDAPLPEPLEPATDETVFAEPRWPHVLVVAIALIWVGLLVWTGIVEGGPITPARASKLVSLASGPLALFGVLWLLAMRSSRREADRFARTSTALRIEAAALEAVIARVADRTDIHRHVIAAQAHALAALGDATESQLAKIGDSLKRDVAALAERARLLDEAAESARTDIGVLLSDLPRAEAQARSLSDALRDAGLGAHEQAGALDGLLATLTARGREADEVAGGAAQRLAAHLARIEGVSEVAGKRMEAAADQMSGAVDSSLLRASRAVDETRRALEDQSAAMLALVEQGEAAMGRVGLEASVGMAKRVADVGRQMDTLSSKLAEQGRKADTVFAGITRTLADIETRSTVVAESGTARARTLHGAIEQLDERLTSVLAGVERGDHATMALIDRAGSLVTILDACTAELDERLPVAFDRIERHAAQARDAAVAAAPHVEALAAAAGSAAESLDDAETTIARQQATLDLVGDRLARIRGATTELSGQIETVRADALTLADGAGAHLVEALVRVRETGIQAADHAREAIAIVIPASAERLATAAGQAMDAALVGRVEQQMAEIASAADRAVEAAHKATDRLMRQMITIADTTASIEARIAEARAEVKEADGNSFSRRVALLVESLNSTAIDVAKVLSNEVTDAAWSAYLKGDRGIFTRRAVRLLDAGEAREIARHYDEEPEFREQVNRYIHDFEAMLRDILANREGTPLGVTLLSSDMGKLYVALAQAIERLR